MIGKNQTDHRQRRHDEECRDELKPAGVEPDGGDQTDRERDPGATAEREVERGNQYEQRAGRGTAERKLALSRHDPRGEQSPDGGEKAKGVPVADWLGEPVSRNGVHQPEPLREEASGEAVGRDDRDRGPGAAEKRAVSTTTDKEQERRECRGIDERPLRLEERSCE